MSTKDNNLISFTDSPEKQPLLSVPEGSCSRSTADTPKNSTSSDSKIRKHVGEKNVNTNSVEDKDINNNNEDDTWEDWCSVCQTGGDLMRCRAPGCTRVYHLYDHIPSLEIANE